MIHFENTKKKIESKRATITIDDSNLPLSKDEFDYYKTEHNLNINDEVFNFYAKYDGIEFDWRMEDDDVSGFINIHSFDEMIDNDTEGKLWVNWYEEEDIEEIKKHRIFETIVGTDYYITIKFEADGTYKLFYVPEGAVNNGGSRTLQEIPLTIEEYLDIISKYYFVYEIRHHLHKKEFYDNPKKFLKDLDKLEKIFGEV